MSRSRRLDFPNALHHILVRGVNKGLIFHDSKDYLYFLRKMGEVLLSTGTKCYAWALMPNHTHLLIRRTKSPVSKVIHRILTSYATYFNKRYSRVGHLFQNRFKSILCQDDEYFLTLVKYIHLNPLKAGIVKNISDLDVFPWTGHHVQIGYKNFDWQQTNDVFQMFGNDQSKAILKYRQFMSKKLTEKEETEMRLGKIVKLPNGVWEKSSVLSKKQMDRAKELILGDDYFIRTVLAYNQKLSSCHATHKFDLNFQKMIEVVSKLCGVNEQQIESKFRKRPAAKARALFCSWCLDELNLPAREIAEQLNMNINAVYSVAARGRELIKTDHSLCFEEAYGRNDESV